MRESEHFNLNLVEGSDIVNPLVTDVPNYESIDEQMFKNQNAGVQNATELKTGTIHAITRIVPDAQMITFTATSNFVAGDTFTVDGIQVSALTVSGEQLPTGAYVINSQVLAILKGTLLTVYGIGSEVADNALALNGHPDTYFGTREDVDNAIDTANAANELVNEVNNKLTIDETPRICGTYMGKPMYVKVIKLSDFTPGHHKVNYNLGGAMLDFCGAKILFHRKDGKRQQAPSNVFGMNDIFELDLYDVSGDSLSYYIGSGFKDDFAITGGSIIIKYTIL